MDGADYLVLTGPHRIGPIGLATWLTQHGESVGLVPVARVRDAGGTKWAYVFRVEDPKVRAIPTVLSTTAAERMAAQGSLHPKPPTVLAGSPTRSLASVPFCRPARSSHCPRHSGRSLREAAAAAGRRTGDGGVQCGFESRCWR